MTSIGSPSPFFLAGKKAYAVERSLRFNDDDDTYLRKSDFGSPDSGTTFTFSAWVIRTELGTWTTIAGSHSGTNAFSVFGIDSNDRLIWRLRNSSSSDVTRIQSENLLRDTNAWYHLLLERNSTLSTAGDRAKLYINGVRVTEFDQNNTDSENETYRSDFLQDINIGRFQVGISSVYYGGMYLAEYHYVDGQALDPSYFTETDPITGQLIPKKYTGGYGTNGFYLNFSDNSGTTATTMGKDSSGNGNNFTPNNFSVATGVGNDSVTDTPTNNFATLNPLSLIAAGGTFSNGNLDFTADSNYATRTGNISLKTGKWYWEVIITNVGTDLHGIVQGTHPNGNIYPGYDTNGNVKGISWFSGSGGLLYGAVPDGATNGATIGAGNTALSSYTTNDVLGFASDIANGTLAFYKNGTLEYTLTGIGSHDWFPAVCGYGTSSTKTINFGQLKATSTTYADANGHGNFKYSVPSGFLAMCTANLPDPTILLPNKHFETKTYVGGDGSAVTISLDFSPDWTWLKSRSSAADHGLYDTVRGVNQRLRANSTGAEDTVPGPIVSNTGFTLNGSGYYNPSSGTPNMISWNWNAGDTDGKTYAVTVVPDSGNKYRFDGFGTSAVTLDLAEGGTYVFDWSDSSAQSHPVRFSTTADGTHGGGTEYTTGVVKDDSAYKTTITVAASAPTLYYYCQYHSGMGGQINTNTTLGSSNFDGSIQSVAKVNATAGFSIVGYTGTGSNATVGHGLGVAPKSIITKQRSTSGHHWRTYHASIGATKSLYLDLNNAESGSDSGFMNNTEPTSTVFSIGTDTNLNENGETHIAYCFSEVAGYSKFGKYTGNGSTNGTFVFTGFRPAFILMKSTNYASYWSIFDNKRDPHNVTKNILYAHLNNAEASANSIDITANGFKLRTSSAQRNGSSNTYIYLAFAESPFKNARAR